MTARLFLVFVLFLSFHQLSAQMDTDFSEAGYFDLGEVVDANEDFSDYSFLKDLLKDVDIIMLGEQSHGEGTVYETKIKLIKYLHQECGFDVVAFESGMFGCDKAWREIVAGEDGRASLAQGLLEVWPYTKEFIELGSYLEEHAGTDAPLELAGFDGQLGSKFDRFKFLPELKVYLKEHVPSFPFGGKWELLEERISYLQLRDYKRFKKKPKADIAYLQSIAERLEDVTHERAGFWQRVVLGAASSLSDVGLKTDHRDQLMFENLVWLKERHPNRKIICWGATSHFLYNSEKVRMKSWVYQLAANYYKRTEMMGDLAKSHFGDRLYTVGFTGYEGRYGFFSKRDLKPATEGTLEFELQKLGVENLFLDLNDVNSQGLLSRPLGNAFMKTDPSEVMDAIIFNRNVAPPVFDREYYNSIKDR